MFYRRTVGRTDGRRRDPRPYEKLLWTTPRRANNIKKGPSKGSSNLDSRYQSMPEPTGGLGGPLVPRPTGIQSSNTCPRNSHIPEYAYNITC